MSVYSMVKDDLAELRDFAEQIEKHSAKSAELGWVNKTDDMLAKLIRVVDELARAHSAGF